MYNNCIVVYIIQYICIFGIFYISVYSINIINIMFVGTDNVKKYNICIFKNYDQGTSVQLFIDIIILNCCLGFLTLNYLEKST